MDRWFLVVAAWVAAASLTYLAYTVYRVEQSFQQTAAGIAAFGARRPAPRLEPLERQRAESLRRLQQERERLGAGRPRE